MTSAAASTLDPQGPAARAMADLWWLMLVLGVLVFLLFAGLLLAGLLTGARRPDDEVAHRRLISRWIGLGGVALPVVVITVVFGATLLAMRDVPTAAPEGALEVEVTGHQFWYEVAYPQHGIVSANELHLPVGRPVALRLTSTDVIHSFWVPALGGKLDMLPERVNTLVLQADEPGVHRSRCAEFCGLQHANMALVVVVDEAADFDAWLRGRQTFEEPTGAQARQGRSVFVGSGCADCHAFRGTTTGVSDGPDLTHLPDRRTIAAGTLPNSTANLRRWIRDPQSVKPGVAMPGTDLSDDDLAALLAYLGADG